MILIDKTVLSGKVERAIKRGNGVMDIYNLIKAADAVDAVPVIRCKDCEYWRTNGERTYCELWETGPQKFGYCYEAEERGFQDYEIDRLEKNGE